MGNLTEHFSWEEAQVTLQRDPETGLLYPNVPPPAAAASLVHTFTEMERVRVLLGKPIRVHSAYRSPAVNRAVGGSPGSQHMKGEAVDFSVRGMPTREAFERIEASHLPYDQLIEEALSWVHVSFVAHRPPRRQALVMRVLGGRASYEPFRASATTA